MSDGALLGSGQPEPHADEHECWLKAAVANGVTTFEAKALYVVGLIRHLLEASGKCVDGEHRFWLPGYVLAADAAEALGRCLTGNRGEGGEATMRLTAGLEAALYPATSITSGGETYDVEALRNLRHFMTHGGTTPKEDRFDPGVVRELSRRLAKRLDQYWVDLGTASGSERPKLAEAKVRPLWTAGTVVFVGDMKKHVSSRGTPGGGLLY